MSALSVNFSFLIRNAELTEHVSNESFRENGTEKDIYTYFYLSGRPS